MTERRTWFICKHIMDGSISKAILRPDGFCGCEECIEDVSIMETHQIHIVEEDRLIGMLKDVETVRGMRHIKIE
jgi:hypothetical protein